MSKTFWAIIAVIVVIFGGILLLNGNDAKAPTNSNVKPTEHIMGEGKTGVKLVEYADFQCPYCGQFYPVMQQVKQKYGEQIFIQFRNLPLVQAHRNALAAARAAEAADKQGKFWEMHDVLFENQTAWSQASDTQAVFNQYASRIGLNVSEFQKAAASSQTNDLVNADIKAFEKTGEKKSTPTFFIDGKKVSPKSISLEAMSEIIDKAIADKEKKNQ